MSDNIAANAANAMIDAVLAGLPKVDGDNDVEMTCPPAIPATSARDANLEPGRVPPWDDKMDVESVTRAAKPMGVKPTPSPVGLPTKPVGVKSTLSRAGVAATPNQPSANSGRSISTALSVSSTPVRALPQFTPQRQPQGVASGALSFTGSPSGRSVSGPTIGWSMGSLPSRPTAGAPRPDPSEQWRRLGHQPLPAVPDRRGGPAGGLAQSSQSFSTAAAPVRSAIPQLSAECQRRGFNPVWQFSRTNVGQVVCRVKVGNTWVEGNTSHDSESAAKASTSNEALQVVRQMPRRASGRHSFTENTNPSTGNRPLGNNRPVFNQGTAFVGRAIPPPQPNIRTNPTVVKREEDVVMRDSAAGEPVRPINAGIPRVETQAINQAPNRARGPQTDTRRGRTQGPQRTGANARGRNGRTSNATAMVAPSENVADGAMLADHIRRSMAGNSHPNASKAFLEGLALGSGLVAALDRFERRRRDSRSRSPTARQRGEGHRGDGHRDEGHHGEGHRGDGHRGEGHRSDGHRGEGYRARSPHASRLRLSPPPQNYLPGRPSSDLYRPVGPSSGQRDGGPERRRENPVPRSTHNASIVRRMATDEAWVHDLFFRHNRIKVEEED